MAKISQNGIERITFMICLPLFAWAVVIVGARENRLAIEKEKTHQLELQIVIQANKH